MDGMEDIVREFIVESNENLDQLDRDLISLEKDPTSKDLLAGIFRAIHTIKGTTGFLGFSRLESVVHAGESLLSRLRDGVLVLNPPITSGLLTMVDAVRAMLASIEATGADGEEDYSALVDTLKRLQASQRVSELRDPLSVPAPKPESAASRELPLPQQEVQPPAPPACEEAPLGQILVQSGRTTEDQVESALNQQRCGDPRRLGEIMVAHGYLQPDDVLDALQTQKEIHSSALSSNSIRVDVGQLDKLMNLVGELVLTRNQILQFSSTQRDATFLNTTQRLSLITKELQEGVMTTRMQPIDNIWSKFPRVVRDLAMACGKQARVEMEGNETGLDKTIIEAIKDPLTHLLRNSIDHGIERPEERIAAGKAAEGRLFLRAFHEGGQVNIEISDDGAGINLGRVKTKAIEQGLVTSEQATRMSERQAANLVFLPGLSTADKVTNVSGRGVGMDVVKTNIEKIGGAVDLQSMPGKGCSVKIKIPLTLAIIPALIVTCRGERYAIPQASLVELLRLQGEPSAYGIETVHGTPVYRLRGNLLSVLYLHQELGLAGSPSERKDVVNIAVLQAEKRLFGLVVDEVNDTEEIVVKPLGKLLKGLSVYAGATIMGDGRVALILDVPGLAQRARAIGEGREKKTTALPGQASSLGNECKALLLFQSSDDRRMVIPLSKVTRLETFARSAVEWAGNQKVVQYRGIILPLLDASSPVQERRSRSRRQPELANDRIHVIIHTRNHRSVGLVVHRILDIVEYDISSRQPPSRRETLGSMVVQGKVTEMLDLAAVIRAQHPSFFNPDPVETAVES